LIPARLKENAHAALRFPLHSRIGSEAADDPCLVSAGVVSPRGGNVREKYFGS